VGLLHVIPGLACPLRALKVWKCEEMVTREKSWPSSLFLYQ
jgi:hypothetical protein